MYAPSPLGHSPRVNGRSPKRILRMRELARELCVYFFVDAIFFDAIFFRKRQPAPNVTAPNTVVGSGTPSDWGCNAATHEPDSLLEPDAIDWIQEPPQPPDSAAWPSSRSCFVPAKASPKNQLSAKKGWGDLPNRCCSKPLLGSSQVTPTPAEGRLH